MLRNIVLFFALSSACLPSFGKTDSLNRKNENENKNKNKNTFYVSALGQWFPKLYAYHSKLPAILQYDPADVFGLSYERIVYKNWGIGVGYSLWNPFQSLYDNVYGPDGQEANELHGKIEPWQERGTLEWISAYKMYDLYVSYRYNELKKHKINAGAGFSYATGKNWVLDTVYFNPPYDNEWISHMEQGHYYGLMAFISYDYLCLHNRVAIGYVVKWRKYFDLYSPQLEYGFNLKYIF